MTITPTFFTALAPMAGYTDAPFRRLCGRLGADLVTGEMISATALTMGDRKTAALAQITEDEPPTVLQLFGHDPDTVGRAAEILLSGDYPGCHYAAPPAGIDLNMGCPVKKIVSNSEGSALMRDPDRAARITAAAKEACVRHGVPLSVKFRAGWDASSINAPAFAVAMAEAGADRVTIHTRTRAQMYAPSADPTIAGAVVDALRSRGFSTPVTGNGDVDSPETATIYRALGCDSVAIGRAAMGDPWLFARLKAPETFIPPTRDEILATILAFVADIVADKGELVGIRESRGRAAHFLKGMRGSARVRDALNHCTTYAAFEAVLKEFEGDTVAF